AKTPIKRRLVGLQGTNRAHTNVSGPSDCVHVRRSRVAAQVMQLNLSANSRPAVAGCVGGADGWNASGSRFRGWSIGMATGDHPDDCGHGSLRSKGNT